MAAAGKSLMNWFIVKIVEPKGGVQLLCLIAGGLSLISQNISHVIIQLTTPMVVIVTCFETGKLCLATWANESNVARVSQDGAYTIL